MINLITGLPGAGKTLFLAKLVRQFLKDGVEVWSYEECRFKDDRVKYFKNINEIKRIKNAVIILDEVQIWFDSHGWQKLDQRIRFALQQHRHKGLDLWGTTQEIGFVDITYRKIIQKYYEIHKVFGTNIKNGKKPKIPWGLYAVREMDKSEVKLAESHRAIKGYRLFWAGKKLFDFYDTEADYDVLEDPVSYLVKVSDKTCPVCQHREVKINWEEKIDPSELKEHPCEIPDTQKPPF